MGLRGRRLGTEELTAVEELVVLHLVPQRVLVLGCHRRLRGTLQFAALGTRLAVRLLHVEDAGVPVLPADEEREFDLGPFELSEVERI